MMGDFGHIRVIVHHTPLHYLGLGFVQLVILLIIHLVLHLDMVKLVCVSDHSPLLP